MFMPLKKKIIKYFKYPNATHGFTLLELVIAMVLLGVLALLGSRAMESMDNARRFQKTLDAMELIREKMIGNPNVMQNGQRADFGYWGYFGAFPATLAALQTGTLWISPYNQAGSRISDTDGWGRPFSYNGPGGFGGNITITSLGADNAAGGTGFNTDLSMTIRIADFTGNTVHVYCADKRGTALMSGLFGGISSVQVISYGVTTTLTYQVSGYWRGTNLRAGPCLIRAFPAAGRQVALGGAASPAYLEMPGVIYPKSGFATNEENIFQVIFPGQLP